MTAFIHHAGTVAVSLAALCGLLYVVSYLRVGWYRSQHGRLMMLLGGGFAVIFTFVAARALTGTPEEEAWLEVVRLLVYLFGLCVTGWMLFLQVRDNRSHRTEAG